MQTLEREQPARGKGVQRAGEIEAPIFGTDEDDSVMVRLEAFGRVSGVPLFPLTEASIEYLSGLALKQGDTLVFIPRAVIGVLRDILLLGRQAFSDGLFPPASIKARRPAEDIAQWLSMLRMPDEQRLRYERLVVIWGNEPQQRTELSRIPVEVFATFSLPPPTGIDSNKTETARPPTPPVLKPDTPPPPDDRRVTRLAEYRKELESWVQHDGPPLNQAVASAIRSSLSAALSDRVDWNEERCVRESIITPSQIAIPHARGSGREASVAIRITQDRSDPDGRLRAELLALLRFHEIWQKDMGYAEVDDDLARIGNLLDRLLSDALSLVRSAVLKQTGTSALLLAANSRLLGITDAGRTPGALKAFLFGEPQTISDLPDGAPEAFADWIQTQRTAAGIRPGLTEALLKTSGCYQGAGKTPNGVDITRVVQVFTETLQHSASDGHFLPSELRETLSGLSDQRVNVRAKRAATEANAIRAQLETKLGKAFDKNETADAMLRLGEGLRDLGAWPETELGATFAAFKALCEDFRSCALKETLGQLDRVNLADSGANVASFIAQVSKVNFGPLVVAARFMSLSEKVIGCGNRHAGTIEAQYRDVKPQMHVESLRNELDQIVSDFSELQNNGNTDVAPARG